MSGHLYVFSGLGGAGKTTALQLLQRGLSKRRVRVWGGHWERDTPVANILAEHARRARISPTDEIGWVALRRRLLAQPGTRQQLVKTLVTFLQRCKAEVILLDNVTEPGLVKALRKQLDVTLVVVAAPFAQRLLRRRRRNKSIDQDLTRKELQQRDRRKASRIRSITKQDPAVQVRNTTRIALQRAMNRLAERITWQQHRPDRR